VAVGQPEPGQRQRQTHPELGIVRPQPLERRAQVVVLGLQALQPVRLPGPALEPQHVLGQPQAVLGVPSPQLVVLAGLAQPFGRVLAYRLQHPVPGVAAGRRLRTHQRLVDQAGQEGQDLRDREVGERADRLRGGQLEAAGEDGEPAEQLSLSLVQ
jgi:hypothetical protein